jgi:hypothetical protein
MNPLILIIPPHLPTLMISKRKPKMTQGKGFIYNTALKGTGKKFQLSQNSL